jgi:hypothetical protein
VGTFVAQYFNTGDYLAVTTDPANQVINGWSAPVTVLPPAATAKVASVTQLSASLALSPNASVLDWATPGAGLWDSQSPSQRALQGLITDFKDVGVGMGTMILPPSNPASSFFGMAVPSS